MFHYVLFINNSCFIFVVRSLRKEVKFLKRMGGRECQTIIYKLWYGRKTDTFKKFTAELSKEILKIQIIKKQMKADSGWQKVQRRLA